MEFNLLSLYAVLAPDPITGAMSIAAAVESQSKALSNLSMHSQRLSRQFERGLTQPRELQKIRRAQAQKDLDMLLDIMEIYKLKRETYHPFADGFVFSEPEMAAALRARNRDRLALEASKHQRAAA
jgi:hypothetical protein